MNQKYAKISIVSLFLLSFAFGASALTAESSCGSLYEMHMKIIDRYDSDQNKKISLQESYSAVSAWFDSVWTDADLLGLLKFARQECVIPSIENDPASGTLSASATQVNVGETIILTVIGKDNDGLQNLWVYYQGSWHNKPTQGTIATTTFSFSEPKAGTYIYKGYIYGSQPSGVKETAWTIPQEVRVTVLPAAVIDCHYYYWFDSDTTACGYKQFCGEFMYYGLRTFSTQQECEQALPVNPSQNDPVSGTLSVSSATVEPGDNIILTITGQDDNGLYALLTYYQGEWHQKLIQGTAADATFTFSESQEGVYTYLGYVYGKTANNNLEFGWTEPKMLSVTVRKKPTEGPDLIISSVSTNPVSLTSSDEVDFKVIIKNIGSERMPVVDGGIITKISSSSMVDSGYRICDAMTTRLGAGESATIDCPIVQTLSVGTHNFTFSTDDGNRLSEANENNNGKTISLTVGQTSTLSVNLTASPSSGVVPLTVVELKATASGTAVGDTTFRFDCTNDGVWDGTYSNRPEASRYHYCDYFQAGAYTAKVRVEAGGLTAQDTATIIVSATGTGQSDPISGIFSTSAASVAEGEFFTLKVVAQDDQGVDKIKIYYKGSWHTFDCGRQTSCTKSYELYESTAGAYTYYAKVYGYDLSGNSENNDASPNYLRVTVTTPVVATCTDSDGGANYSVKGSSSSTVSGVEGRVDCCKLEYSTYMGDSVNHIGTGGGACVTSGPYLYEAICQNGVPYTTVYTCPWGCQDGICK